MFCMFYSEYFIIEWLYLSWQNAICTKFWMGAVVRYYGNWKWYCFYIVSHKPVTFGHLVGNKLYFTKILNFIPIEGKSKGYKHSLIYLFIELIYWTALVLLHYCLYMYLVSEIYKRLSHNFYLRITLLFCIIRLN